MARQLAHATLTGPGVDRRYSAGPAVALSAAITLAGRASVETTLYVRTPSGDPYGRVERDLDGTLTVIRNGKERQ